MGVTGTIRPIGEDDVEEWTATMLAAFHAVPVEGEAAARRARWDLERTLAAVDGGRIVGTLRSFRTEVTLPGGAQEPASGITNAAVLPTHRRQGNLSALMHEDLSRSIGRGERLAVLGTAEYPIYPRYGFGPATELMDIELDATVDFVARPETGTVDLVSPSDLRKIGLEVYERVRAVRPGTIIRPEMRWDVELGIVVPPGEDVVPKHAMAALYRDAAGVAQGFARFHSDQAWGPDHRPASVMTIDEMLVVTPDASAALWRFVCSIDLVRRVKAGDRPVDELLPWLVSDARAVQRGGLGDGMWVRVLDVPAVLEARRYPTEGSLVIEVVDPLDHAAGRFRLDAGPEGAVCERTDRPADITLPVGTLGSVVLGAHRWPVLAAAGAMREHAPGAVERGDRLFDWPIAPWCPIEF